MSTNYLEKVFDSAVKMQEEDSMTLPFRSRKDMLAAKMFLWRQGKKFEKQTKRDCGLLISMESDDTGSRLVLLKRKLPDGIIIKKADGSKEVLTIDQFMGVDNYAEASIDEIQEISDEKEVKEAVEDMIECGQTPEFIEEYMEDRYPAWTGDRWAKFIPPESHFIEEKTDES